MTFADRAIRGLANIQNLQTNIDSIYKHWSMEFANHKLFWMSYIKASLLKIADKDDGKAPKYLILFVRSGHSEVLVDVHKETLSNHRLLIDDEQTTILEPQLQLELIDVVLLVFIDGDGKQAMKSLASDEKGSTSRVGSSPDEILAESNGLTVFSQCVKPEAFPWGPIQ